MRGLSNQSTIMEDAFEMMEMQYPYGALAGLALCPKIRAGVIAIHSPDIDARSPASTIFLGTPEL